MNYQFLDAFASVKTAASSTVGGIEYPIIKIPDTVSVSIIGAVPVNFSGSPSISGAVTIVGTPSISGTVNITGIPSVSGTVQVGNFPTTQNVSGSVAAFQAGTHSPSAIGYAYRNDNLASTLGADLTFGPMMRDSSGRLVIKPFAADDSATFSFSTSVVSTSVTLIKASVIGKRNYVTDMWLTNTGATTTVVTLKDGSTSVVGYLPAPTGGGVSSPGLAIPLRTAPSQDLTFQPTSANSILYITVNGFQAP